MSLILRDLDERHALLPLAAAVAVCEACEAAAPPAIKWPNDVWIDRRKVAGILIEGRPQEGWAVLGIGLNVTTDSFPPELARDGHIARDSPATTPPPPTRSRRASSPPSTAGSARRPEPAC